MTKSSRSGDKDPRATICAINQWGKHRWSTSFKDKISKTAHIQVLRCRYCAKYVSVHFERLVLPSGRVTITEHVDAIQAGDKAAATTVALRAAGVESYTEKHIENTSPILTIAHSLTHSEGAAGSKQHNGQDKQVTKV